MLTQPYKPCLTVVDKAPDTIENHQDDCYCNVRLALLMNNPLSLTRTSCVHVLPEISSQTQKLVKILENVIIPKHCAITPVHQPYLKLPSIMTLSVICNCGELELLEALNTIRSNGYDVQTFGLDLPILVKRTICEAEPVESVQRKQEYTPVRRQDLVAC